MQYDESESENSIQTENKMITSNSTEDNKENVENLENAGNKPIIKQLKFSIFRSKKDIYLHKSK